MSNTETLRTAAQQALEAMQYTGMDVGKFNRINAACSALRAALAQPATDDRWNEGFKHGQWLAKHSAPVVERADCGTKSDSPRFTHGRHAMSGPTF